MRNENAELTASSSDPLSSSSLTAQRRDVQVRRIPHINSVTDRLPARLALAVLAERAQEHCGRRADSALRDVVDEGAPAPYGEDRREVEGGLLRGDEGARGLLGLRLGGVVDVPGGGLFALFGEDLVGFFVPDFLSRIIRCQERAETLFVRCRVQTSSQRWPSAPEGESPTMATTEDVKHDTLDLGAVLLGGLEDTDCAVDSRAGDLRGVLPFPDDG